MEQAQYNMFERQKIESDFLPLVRPCRYPTVSHDLDQTVLVAVLM